MKKRPIIFSELEVCSVLSGVKTQKRVPVTGTALSWIQDSGFSTDFVACRENHLCSYGIIGDRLWVREIWNDFCPLWEGVWCGCGSKKMIKETHKISYKATKTGFEYISSDGKQYKNLLPNKWKSPISMPEWASRIALKITDIRIERLQQITNDDKIAEGYSWEDCHEFFDQYWDLNKRKEFRFRNNPWVWVLEFKSLTQTPEYAKNEIGRFIDLS